MRGGSSSASATSSAWANAPCANSGSYPCSMACARAPRRRKRAAQAPGPSVSGCSRATRSRSSWASAGISRPFPGLRGLEQEPRPVLRRGELRGLGERGSRLRQLARVRHQAGEQQEGVLAGLGGHRGAGEASGAGLVSGLLCGTGRPVEQLGALGALRQLGPGGQDGGAGERVVLAAEQRDQQLERLGVSRTGAPAGGERFQQPAGLVGLAGLHEKPRQLQLQLRRRVALRRPGDQRAEDGGQRPGLAPAAMCIGERQERGDVARVRRVRALHQGDGPGLVVEDVGRELGGLHQEIRGTGATRGLRRALEEGR